MKYNLVFQRLSKITNVGYEIIIMLWIQVVVKINCTITCCDYTKS